MRDLTFHEVSTLSTFNGFDLSEEDVTEVTHRLNTIIASVDGFAHPDLETTEPEIFHPLEDTNNEQ